MSFALAIACCGISVIQVFHSLLAGWTPHANARQVRLWQLLIVGPLVFVSQWICMTIICAVYGFALHIESPTFARQWGGIGAAFVALIVTSRLSLGRVSPKYSTIQLGCSICVLLLFGAANFHSAWSRIEGWTAISAARRVLEYSPQWSEADLVPLQTSDSTCRFRVMLDDEPRGMISVNRIYKFGWCQSSSSLYGTASDELNDLRERAGQMKHSDDPHNLADSLRAFLRNHAGTPEADEATRWLSTVQAKVNVIDQAAALGGRFFLLQRIVPLKDRLFRDPDSLTQHERSAAIVFAVYEELTRVGLNGYFQRDSARFSGEAVQAIREMNATQAADWLEKANTIAMPFLDPGQKAIDHTKREAFHETLRKAELDHHEEILPSILDRLVLYCDQHDIDCRAP